MYLTFGCAVALRLTRSAVRGGCVARAARRGGVVHAARGLCVHRMGDLSHHYHFASRLVAARTSLVGYTVSEDFYCYG